VLQQTTPVKGEKGFETAGGETNFKPFVKGQGEIGPAGRRQIQPKKTGPKSSMSNAKIPTPPKKMQPCTKTPAQVALPVK